MKKKISLLIDELSITNIKIYMLIEKAYKNKDKVTGKDFIKAQKLNQYRAELCNALDEEFKENPYIKVYGDEE